MEESQNIKKIKTLLLSNGANEEQVEGFVAFVLPIVSMYVENYVTEALDEDVLRDIKQKYEQLSLEDKDLDFNNLFDEKLKERTGLTGREVADIFLNDIYNYLYEIFKATKITVSEIMEKKIDEAEISSFIENRLEELLS
ncbi:MAG: hypothetical protein KatS3mg086_013 [Candidatus Dojkabacteria bacterium]|nr:MAG: hypothetical protein KatS3mg086_013 [Candidatus Dojkabacteria bacterium]